MRKSQILEWVQNEFLPLKLAMAPEALSQIYENAIRYFNTHSALRHLEMFNVSAGSQKIELSTKYITVSEVYPSRIQSDIIQNHPWWVLLNMTVLDNVTSDLVQLAHSFQEYSVYIGRDFHYQFVDSHDPATAPMLLVENVPAGADKVCVIGARRIDANEDIKSEHILDFLLYYIKALVKMGEGAILRKADINNINNDGQIQYQEGVSEKKELEERLAVEGRWLSFCKRI